MNLNELINYITYLKINGYILEEIHDGLRNNIKLTLIQSLNEIEDILKIPDSCAKNESEHQSSENGDRLHDLDS